MDVYEFHVDYRSFDNPADVVNSVPLLYKYLMANYNIKIKCSDSLNNVFFVGLVFLWCKFTKLHLNEQSRM